MNPQFVNALYEARCNAGFTQERAAEILNISTRSMGKYESGMVTPSDERVAEMVKVYNAPWLGYLYLSRVSPTGKLLLPVIEPAGISSQALRLSVSMRRAHNMQAELENVCADDRIESKEAETFAACVRQYSELAAACIALKMGMKKAG